MQEFHGQNLVDLDRVVPVSAEMSMNDSFERIPVGTKVVVRQRPEV